MISLFGIVCAVTKCLDLTKYIDKPPQTDNGEYNEWLLQSKVVRWLAKYPAQLDTNKLPSFDYKLSVSIIEVLFFLALM